MWSDAAKQALEIYQALAAAANTSSTIETRSSFYASLQRQQRRWTRRRFSLAGLRSTYPRAIAMDSPAAVETKQLSTRGFAAEEPQFDFAAPTVAITCGDAIDTSHVTTTDVFREIIHAASTVSQMIGPQWSPEMYCHRCVVPLFILSICQFRLVPTVTFDLHISADGPCAPLSVITVLGIASSRIRFLSLETRAILSHL